MSGGDNTITRADLDAALRAERLRIAEALGRAANPRHHNDTRGSCPSFHRLADELRASVKTEPARCGVPYRGEDTTRAHYVCANPLPCALHPVAKAEPAAPDVCSYCGQPHKGGGMCCQCAGRGAPYEVEWKVPAAEDCPGCAKVKRHPGEGYGCSFHPETSTAGGTAAPASRPRPICDTPGCGREIPVGGEGHPEICPKCLAAPVDAGEPPPMPTRLVAWCPQCGMRPSCDEDGCCAACGATVGEVVDGERALACAEWHDRERRRLERALVTAREAGAAWVDELEVLRAKAENAELRREYAAKSGDESFRRGQRDEAEAKLAALTRAVIAAGCAVLDDGTVVNRRAEQADKDCNEELLACHVVLTKARERAEKAEAQLANRRLHCEGDPAFFASLAEGDELPELDDDWREQTAEMRKEKP